MMALFASPTTMNQIDQNRFTFSKLFSFDTNKLNTTTIDAINNELCWALWVAMRRSDDPKQLCLY